MTRTCLCGDESRPDSWLCAKCGDESRPDSWLCAKCAEGAARCSACGVPLIDHTGMYATCAELQRVKDENAKLKKSLATVRKSFQAESRKVHMLRGMLDAEDQREFDKLQENDHEKQD